MTDTNPPADRIAEIKARDDLTAEEQLADNPSLFADQAAARIRAYFPRFPLMKTVGPEIAHDLRDADGHPYALPIIDVIAVLDDLDRTNMAFESQTNNWRRARKERDAALARVEELERQIATVQAAGSVEEWGVRRRDGRVMALGDREDAQAFADGWRGGNRTIVRRVIGPWEPVEEPSDEH